MSPRKSKRRRPPQRTLATIMFADIVGFSALTSKNESLALELLEEHRKLLRPLFKKYEGTEIKTIGDAFLIEFPSALDGVRCAIAMQKTIFERNASEPPERRIQIRIGLHLGDIEHRENDVYGDGVNIAARIEPLAEPGGICISEDLARQILNKIDEPIVKLGKSDLKNIEAAMGIYRVLLPWEEWLPTFSQRVFFSLRKSQPVRLTIKVLAFLLLAMIWVRDRPVSPTEAGIENDARKQEAPVVIPGEEVKTGLRAYLDGKIAPQALRISYEELHPTKGGSRIVVKATGEVLQEGEDTYEILRDLTEIEVENLVRLLLDINAWEQDVPWQEPGPEDIRVYLRVQAGGASSTIWEWQKDLDENRRIVQVLDQLKRFALLEKTPKMDAPKEYAGSKQAVTHSTRAKPSSRENPVSPSAVTAKEQNERTQASEARRPAPVRSDESRDGRGSIKTFLRQSSKRRFTRGKTSIDGRCAPE